jgi:hypothetical protein
MSARLALLVGAALWCGGCTVSSDVGKSCVLVRKATEEERAAFPQLGETRSILENQLKAGQDFISFGSVECEDLVCVRDASYNPNLPAGSDPSTVAAKGYCSKACVVDPLQNSCAVTTSDVEEEVASRMSCRALLLDQLALEELRRTDPAAYRATFGDNNSPFFCAGSKPSSEN